MPLCRKRYKFEYSRMDQVNVWKTVFKMFYSLHSWIFWHVYSFEEWKGVEIWANSLTSRRSSFSVVLGLMGGASGKLFEFFSIAVDCGETIGKDNYFIT